MAEAEVESIWQRQRLKNLMSQLGYPHSVPIGGGGGIPSSLNKEVPPSSPDCPPLNPEMGVPPPRSGLYWMWFAQVMPRAVRLLWFPVG